MTSARSKHAGFAEVLDRLEARYGKLVPSDDPVEAGILTLLAIHAPQQSTTETRDRLREAFTDWNEMRVSDPWEISNATEAPEREFQAFARATLRFLESINAVLHRTSFDGLRSGPVTEAASTLEKMRGASAPVRAVVLAALDPAKGWHLGPETVKVIQKLGVIGKTTSSSKAGKEMQEIAAPEERLRAHYLLTRYATREKDEDDPLEVVGSGRRSAGKAKGGRNAKPAKESATKE